MNYYIIYSDDEAMIIRNMKMTVMDSGFYFKSEVSDEEILVPISCVKRIHTVSEVRANEIIADMKKQEETEAEAETRSEKS